MKKYMIMQVFSVIVALVLVSVFYTVLAADLVRGAQTNLEALILIIIAITCLAILSALTKIEYYMRKGKK